MAKQIGLKTISSAKTLEYNPEHLIGKKYEKGLLPYGGCVNSSGKITFALSKKEFEREMEKLRTLE